MKRDHGNRVSPSGDEPSKVPDRLQKIAAASATMIFALQSTAFARPSGTDQAQAFDIGRAAPLLGPGELAALGAMVATIGAYRLRKARRRSGQAKGERNEP